MIVKQGELRSNLKKYFDIVINEEPVIVPRKDNRNIVILSEKEYRDLIQNERMRAYSDAITNLNGVKLREEDLSGHSFQIPTVKSYTETTDIRTDNLDRLSVIEEFKDNWNGNGARAFDKGLIKNVTEIVRELDIQPEIFPSAAGTIELEYSNSRKDFMGIEIGEDCKAEVFIVMYNGRELFEEIETTAEAINERVKVFYE